MTLTEALYGEGASFGAVYPAQTTGSVYIPMNKTLDQALTMNVAPPTPGPKRPDRLRATVSVQIAASAFALLPAGLKTPYLPVSGPITGSAGVTMGAYGGTLTLAGANTYTGGTFVGAGSLRFSADANLGSTAGPTGGAVTLGGGVYRGSTNPSRNGAGGHSSFTHTKPITPKAAVM